MGLDNGIMVRINNKINNESCELEVCYWRNFHELREEIVKYYMEFEDEEFYTIDLSVEQLKGIYSIIQKHTHLDYISRPRINKSHTAFTNRVNLAKLDVCFSFLNNEIDINDFIETISSWQDDYIINRIEDQLDDICATYEQNPEDIEIKFSFYDSY